MKNYFNLKNNLTMPLGKKNAIAWRIAWRATLCYYYIIAKLKAAVDRDC